jgi:lipopolysaccharide assembly outer membrane protein LptD (OstA)
MTPRKVAAVVLAALAIATCPAAGQAPPLFNEEDGWTLEARQMLGEEDVGGLRHIMREVVITQGTVRITAPRGYYYPSLNTTSLGGGVRLADRTLTVTADSAAYHRGRGELEGYGGVVVTDRDLRLTGNRGTYDRLKEVVTLDGDVRGDHDGRRISGDRLVYNRRSQLVEVSGDAVVEDPAHNSVVRGHRLLYDIPTRVATVVDRPTLEWRKGEEEVAIEGDRMRFLDGGNLFQVAGNVRAVQGRQTARADSAIFFDREGRAYLYGSPSVSDLEGNLTGDSLALNFEGGVLNRADMKGNAVLVYIPTDPDLIGERSVIRGDSLSIFFVDGIIDRLQAFGDPTIEYTPSRADSASGTGSVTASADTVNVIIEKQTVERVELAGGASGRYFYRPRANADSLDQVDYAANRITFHIPRQLISLRGAAQTDYHALTLKADEIDFDARKEELVAQPKPILIDRTRPSDQEVVGERVTYDLVSSRGTIYHGRTQYEDGYIFADSLRKVSEDEFSAGSGQYTTCDLIGRDLEPHYHFSSDKMKIYLGDKVVARPVTLFIGKIPIFALPFYVFSIRKGRHSGLLLPRFEFGFTGSGDRFFENMGYYWAANDYTDYLFKVAYRENPGALIGDMTARYNKRGLLDGQVDLGHVWGLDRGLNQVRIRHNQTLGEDFRLTADGEFGDGDFRFLRRDIGTRVDRVLRSNAGLTKSWRQQGITVSVNASETRQLDADLTDTVPDNILSRTLPAFSASLAQKTIGRKKVGDRPAFLPWASSITWNLSVRGSRSESRRESIRPAQLDSLGDTTRVLESRIVEDRSENAVWSSSIRDTRKLLGFIDFSPSMSVNEHWVDREFSPSDTVKGFRRAATYSLSLRTGTTAYGTFFPRIGPMTALRHTVNPSVTLGYNPEFRNLTFAADTLGGRRNRFPGVGGVASQTLSYSLDNRFQAKVQKGEDVRRIDLLNWDISGSYNILAARRGDLHPASNINNSIRIPPVGNLNLNFSSDHNPYHQLRMEQFTLTSSMRLAGRLPGSEADEVESTPPTAPGSAAPAIGYNTESSLYDTERASDTSASGSLGWHSSLGLSYRGFRTATGLNPEATLTGTFDVNLTRSWTLNYRNAYSFKNHQFTYQRVELQRDLHCWQASFSYDVTDVRQEFYFRISVKALPDIKFERGPGFGALDALDSFTPGGGGFGY